MEAGELCICLEDGNIAGAMVLNHQCNEGYGRFKWQAEASEGEILVIRALGVHPAYGGKGYG
ncbi:MAG: GNAT family N-acetyltransferase [Aeromonadales bacterium]|nr:GNAT family N-acetyltransferase [Aeromonadales bacterium]MDY2890116.1 GNAT family N-acetyltransferase [Succinivibrio sp.]